MTGRPERPLHATGDRIEVRRVLPARPDEVFRAWTDPAYLGRWMSPLGSADVKLDQRVGGAFRIVMVGGGAAIEHSGEYLEIVPGERLRFTWRSSFTGPEPSVVSVAFMPHPDETEVVITHGHLPPGAAESHGQGWSRMLERLRAELGFRPGERP